MKPAGTDTISALSFALWAMGGGVAAQGVETLDCVILPGREVALASPSQGLLSRIEVERTDRVTAGQIVAELTTEIETASLALARLMAEDDTLLQAARIRLKLEEELLGSSKALSERNIVSNQALSERLTTYELRLSEVAQAEQAMKQAALQLAEVEARLEARRIRSPIDGVVLERLLEPGEFLREDTPVLRIGQLDRLKVEVILPQTAYHGVKPGQSVMVEPEHGSAAGPLVARVDKIDPVIDPASGTFGVTLDLDNGAGAVVAGVNCLARFGALPGAD